MKTKKRVRTIDRIRTQRPTHRRDAKEELQYWRWYADYLEGYIEGLLEGMGKEYDES